MTRIMSILILRQPSSIYLCTYPLMYCILLGNKYDDDNDFIQISILVM